MCVCVCARAWLLFGVLFPLGYLSDDQEDKDMDTLAVYFEFVQTVLYPA